MGFEVNHLLLESVSISSHFAALSLSHLSICLSFGSSSSSMSTASSSPLYRLPVVIPAPCNHHPLTHSRLYYLCVPRFVFLLILRFFFPLPFQRWHSALRRLCGVPFGHRLRLLPTATKRPLLLAAAPVSQGFGTPRRGSM